jgi:hypothetical protein
MDLLDAPQQHDSRGLNRLNLGLIPFNIVTLFAKIIVLVRLFGNPRNNPVTRSFMSRMNAPETGRSAAGRALLAVIAVLVGLLGLFVPDLMIRERGLSMSKIASADESKALRDPTMPAARDPRIAVEEEYQVARRQGTAQALELFIARHPNDPLADKARADLRLLPR